MFTFNYTIKQEDLNYGNHVGNERALLFFRWAREEFLRANNLAYKVTLPFFAKAMQQGLKQNKCTFEYKRTKRKQGFQTNVHFKDIEEFKVLFMK